MSNVFKNIFFKNNKSKKELETIGPEKLDDNQPKIESVDEKMSREEAERLAETKNKIESGELTPVMTDGLSPEDKLEADKIETAAQGDLEVTKKESLDGLKKVEKLILTTVAVDINSIVQSRSYNKASESLTAGKEELKGFSGFFKRIWKYNLAEQAYHQAEKIKTKKSILKEGNIYAADDLSEAEKKTANEEFRQSLLQRFTADIKDELVEEGLGEKREELKAETPEEQKIKIDLKNIINDYADGKIDEAAFEAKKRDIFVELNEYKKNESNNSSAKKEKYEKTELYLDNFLEMAEKVRDIKNNIRQAQDHQKKLAQFDFEINLVLGKAKEGLKTETHYNKIDQTIENIRRTKLGALMNETTLALIVSGAGSLVSKGVQSLARNRAVAYGTLGLSALVAGGFAGLKENQMQKRERQTLERRSALNQKTDSQQNNEKRSEEISQEISELEATKLNTTDKKAIKTIDKKLKNLTKEQEGIRGADKFIYDKEKASLLYDDLSESLYEQGPKGEKIAKKLDSDDDRDKLFNCLSNVEARLQLSNERKIDLISYSDITKVETERLNLLILKAEARKRLSELSKDDGKDYGSQLKLLTDVYRSQIIKGEDGNSGLELKDKEFNKYKNNAVLKKVALGVATGLIIGTAVQEGVAFLTDKQEGLVENLIKGNDRTLGYHDTLLQNLLGHHSSGSLHFVTVEHGMVTLPSNCDLVKDAAGAYTLQRGSDILASHLTIDGNGSFTEEAKRILAEQNINLNASQNLIESGQTIVTGAHSNPDDYVNKNPDKFKLISRDRWNENGTPMYKGLDGKWHGANLNELKEQWAGDHGSGINTKTDCYELTAFKMTADGSFHMANGVKLSENAAELIKGGKMKCLFSLSVGTQNHVIELQVDPKTGIVSVPRGSEYAKLLFGERNGQAFLKAKFSEIATSLGLGKGGAEKFHIFATAVGEGLKEVDSPLITEVPPITSTASILDIPRDFVPPPVIPIISRKPLEKIKPDNTSEVVPNSYYGYSENLKKDKRELKMYRNNPSKIRADFIKTTNSKSESKSDKTLDKKRGPLFITPDGENYNSGTELKSDNIKIKDYINQPEKLNSLVSELKNDPKYKKYDFVVDQLNFYFNYDKLSVNEKNEIKKNCDHYNASRNYGAELSAEEYVGLQIGRLQNQIENIFISEAKVGEKPFSPDFYKEAPLVKGINRAEEIVVILDDPIGDAVLTIPAVLAIRRYLEENKQEKPIKLAVNNIGLKLFKCLADQFPGKIELVSCGNQDNNFAPLKKSFASDKKEKFIINAHKEFANYGLLNLNKDESEDISRVMSVDWSSWVKEEVPKRRGLIEKYDAIPARIMRNFEVMCGQKLFSDINKMDHFLEKENNHDKVSAELKGKYQIKPDEEVIVISAGSSVMPKEYEPAKWEEAIRNIIKEHPKSKILFLEDPSPERQARYNPMVQKLMKDTGKISLVNESLDKMNALLSMADLVITPDTGLGHYAGALGKPNIMLILGDPVRWSTAKTERIIHKKGRETYAKNAGTYDKAWRKGSGYYVNDNEEMVGSSNLSPKLIVKAADKYLRK